MAQQGLTRPPAMGREEFLAGLREAARQAAAAAGGWEEHHVEIAGLAVRLRFAGPALVDALTSALAHARTAPVPDPALTVDVWDSDSTHTTMPRQPWEPQDVREHGRIRGLFDHEVQATYRYGALGVLEPAAGRALYWVRTAEGFPFFERAAPLRSLLHLWLAGQDRQLVHAAALGDAGGCVMLAGSAGTGKSSAALACLASPVGHVADDFCVLEGGEPALVHALYSSAKANPDTLERLAIPSSAVANPVREPGDKAVLFLHQHAPGKLVALAPLRAVAVPVITGTRDTRVTLASPGAALAALAPSTMLQLPGTGASTLRRLAEVVRSGPCYRLEVGTDPRQVPEALARLAAP